MKKLVFNDSRQIEIQSAALAGEGILRVRIILTNSESLKALFGDTFATQKMTCFENQQQIAVYENYTEFKYIKEETGGIFEVEMRQTGADTETRLTDLEDNAKQQAKDIEQLKKDVEEGGTIVDQELFAATAVVARANAQALSNQEALSAKVLYEKWQALADAEYTAEKAGYKFTHEDILYKTIKDNQQFQAQWVPGQGTESIFERIDETHAGTQEDPIPWHTNMRPELGKYYTEGNLLAKCIEDPGQALQNKLSELCPGRYFEVAE